MYIETNNLFGTVTNRYSILLKSPGGFATNDFGVYQEGAGQKNFFAGTVGIGTTTPVSSLDLSSKTDGINMPKGTTAQQLACNAATEGNLRYNSQVKLMEFCNGTAWQRLPAVQTAAQTAPAGSGYFVLSAGTYDGNLGDLSGADATCLTDLTSNNWMGKAAAIANGQLNSSKVKSFLCNSVSCNNLIPLATYYFATSGDASAGGASFATDSSASGPGDNIVWSSANYFQASAQYWTNRDLGTGTSWGNVPYNPGYETYCSNPGPPNWNNTSGGHNGIYGDTSQTGTGRWNASAGACSTSRRLLCLVNP